MTQCAHDTECEPQKRVKIAVSRSRPIAIDDDPNTVLIYRGRCPKQRFAIGVAGDGIEPALIRNRNRPKGCSGGRQLKPLSDRE